MANDFSPRVNFDKPENLMNYSKGYDTAAGAIGKGVGQLGSDIAQGILVADATMKTAVNEEVRSAVEDANAQYYGIQADPLKSPGKRDLPQELTVRLRRLERMKTGVEQGKMPDAHYNMQLHKESKDIRARYSGYADEIDQAFTQLTGTTPARAIIRDIQAAERAASAASASSEKRNAAFIDSFIKSGYAPPNLVMELVKPGAASNEDLMARARIEYGKQAAFKTNMGLKMDYMQLQDKSNSLETKNIESNFNEYVFNQYQNTVVGSTDYKRLQDLHQQALREASNGGSLTKGTEEQIRTLVGVLQQKVQMTKDDAIAQFNRRVDPSKPSFLSRIPEAQKNMFEFLDRTMAGITDGLSKGDFAVVNLNAKLVESTNARNSAELIEANKTAARIGVTEKLFGAEAASRVWGGDTGTRALKEIDQFTTNMQMIDTATGEVKALTQQYYEMGIKGTMTPGAARGLFDKTMTVLKSDGVDPATYMKFADTLVGKQNSQFFEMLPAEARTEIYKHVTSPAMYAKMKEYAGKTGRFDALENYQKFIFNAIPQLGRTSVDTINELNAGSSSVSIEFNPEMNRFVVRPANSTATTPIGRGASYLWDWANRDTSRANEAVDELNGIVGNLEQLALANGNKPLDDAEKIVMQMGFDPSIIKQGNLIDRANKATKGDLPGKSNLGGPKENNGFFNKVEMSRGPEEGSNRFRYFFESMGLSPTGADTMTQIMDTITGTPSLADAVNNGDKAAIGAALAGTVVPFVPKGIGGKVAGEVIDKTVKAAGNVNIDPFKQALTRLPDRLGSLKEEMTTIGKNALNIITTHKDVLTPTEAVSLLNLDSYYKTYERQIAKYKKFLENADPNNPIDVQTRLSFEDALGRTEQQIQDGLTLAEDLGKNLGPREVK